jgi:hypothetical protein
VPCGTPAGEAVVEFTAADTVLPEEIWGSKTVTVVVPACEKPKAFAWWIGLVVGIVVLGIAAALLAFFVMDGEDGPKVDTSPPTEPTDFVGRSKVRQVVLTWRESEDDVGVVAYVLTRDDERVDRIDAPVERYFDREACAGKSDFELQEVEYALSAVDGAGNSSRAARETVLVRCSIFDG